MPLDIRDIKPRKGTFSSNLWENATIGLPLSLFYSIEIPLEPFHSGHTYVKQPTNTSICIDWVKLINPSTGNNEKNWKNFTGKKYPISYDDESGEGSIYLGSEHCQFDAQIEFFSRIGTTFDIALTLAVNFNIDTINLEKNNQFSIRTQIDYQGLLLYGSDSLPAFSNTAEPMKIISRFIDTNVYSPRLTHYENPHVQWRQLKPSV